MVAANALENNGSGANHAAKYTVMERQTLRTNAGEVKSAMAASRIPSPM